jgi:hypothetical protein
MICAIARDRFARRFTPDRLIQIDHRMPLQIGQIAIS